MIAIKWGESTHFPGRNNSGRIDPGRNDPVPFYVVLFKLYFLMITMLYMAMKMIGKIKLSASMKAILHQIVKNLILIVSIYALMNNVKCMTEDITG
jgi:hypothetical protein